MIFLLVPEMFITERFTYCSNIFTHTFEMHHRIFYDAPDRERGSILQIFFNEILRLKAKKEETDILKWTEYIQHSLVGSLNRRL